MTRGRLAGVAALVALASVVTVASIELSRRDRDLVPAWRLGDHATTAQVQRLADRLGIPGEARRTRLGWVAEEGGVRLVVRRTPGLPWRAGPVGEASAGVPASAGEATRVAQELVHDVGGPPTEVVDDAPRVTLRPVVVGQPVSAMPWGFVVEAGGRVVRASGWLNKPVPVYVTPDELRRDDRLLPRRDRQPHG